MAKELEVLPVPLERLEEVILMPSFRFPQHYQIQEWLSGTEYGEYFDLALVEVIVEGRRGKESNKLMTTPALKPKTDKIMFLWKLKGNLAAKDLEQKVLDFHKK